MTARRTILTLGITAAASLGLLAAGAAPASAALPEGDTLYGIACPYYSADDAKLPPLQLLDLDSDTAVGTPVGVGTPSLAPIDCALQGAWNPVTQTAYAVAQVVGGPVSLVTIDLASGVSTPVGQFTLSGAPTYVAAIAISLDGIGYAIGNNVMYSVNLATAELTVVGASTNMDGLAFDPSTGLLYGLQNTGNLYLMDTTTGGLLLLGYVGQGATYSMTIDSAGVLWYHNDTWLGGDDYEAGLWSVPIDDLAGGPEFAGTVSVGEGNPYVEGLFLTWPPPPALAATGSTDAASAPIALTGAAALLLAGVAAIVIRRTRRA
jgi:hypothetical protein